MTDRYLHTEMTDRLVTDNVKALRLSVNVSIVYMSYSKKVVYKSIKDIYQTMQLNNENDSLISLKRLSANNDYYNVVFKKTERIASAVFYVLAHVALNERTRVHYDNVSLKAMALHEVAIASLNLYEYEVRDKIYDLKQSLVTLASTLHISVAAGLLTSDIEAVVGEEIEIVLRYLRNHYTNDASTRPTLTPGNTTATSKSIPITKPRRPRPQIPQNDLSSDAVLVYSDLGGRTERIKTVLDAKPNATIKDLSEIITDVSTKTIQRDLNSLIDSGQVMRQGERRWSTYSIVK